MRKSGKKTRKKSLQSDYERLLRVGKLQLPLSDQQWAAQGDYFVKFSLYKDSPSIASPGTTLVLNP